MTTLPRLRLSFTRAKLDWRRNGTVTIFVYCCNRNFAMRNRVVLSTIFRKVSSVPQERKITKEVALRLKAQ